MSELVLRREMPSDFTFEVDTRCMESMRDWRGVQLTVEQFGRELIARGYEVLSWEDFNQPFVQKFRARLMRRADQPQGEAAP